ncbi:hypothetical protein [Persicobacter psychrovividus]|uniref:Lipid A biosynthesis protein n=1 Tax=Persicobacter psychrovividus TaxID=387638 RepID=A0ABN6LCT3_9BACT|nr:lipid A biosynthesis protein [Persicobacter psychrovividus]
MFAVVYYLILIPVSLLPNRLQYFLSDLIYLIIRYIVPYRRKIVLDNIRRSFPEKSEQEVNKIANQFYAHFCDLIIESIDLFTITEKQIRQRFQAGDIEALNTLYEKNKSVVFASGHYNNWEIAATAIPLLLKHKVDGLYAPLSNKFLDQKFLKSRQHFGLKMFPKKQVKAMFESHKGQPTVSGFGADQCPPYHTRQAYFTKFLNQDTPVMFGTEKYAKEYDHAVCYMHVRKLKRGHYIFDAELICEDAQATPYGEITEKHTRMLEKDILANPQYWLWTHKRWKLTRERVEENARQYEAEQQAS